MMMFNKHLNAMWPDMEKEMGRMFDRMNHQTSGYNNYLLPFGQTANRLLPAIRGEFLVDVLESDDEVIVVVDIPGVEKSGIILNLVNSRALEISCERKVELESKNHGCVIRERSYGMMRRVVEFSTDVTSDGAKAKFDNGVLKVHLKKTTVPVTSKIKVD